MYTLTEKLLKSALVEGEMKAGKRITIKPNQSLSHDLNVIMTLLTLESANVRDKKIDLAVQYIDHNMLQSDFKNDDDHRYILDMTNNLGIICAKPGLGICHSLHAEHFGKPGDILIGGDSHTVAAGALGMFSVGVGGFDSARAIAGQNFTLNMPEIVEVRLTGELQDFVSAKDIVLELLRRVGVKGGIGKVFEYTGEGTKSLSLSQRFTIADMGQETGATTSVFPSDENTYKWLKAYGRADDYKELHADEGAKYSGLIEINLDKLEPLIALPHLPDKVVKVRDVVGKKIDQVMIGSCTNTSLRDLMVVENILDNNKCSESVDVGIYPSTRTVQIESIKRGVFGTFLKAGARIFEPSCGGCNGSGFAPSSNSVSLRTTPRNFLGRSGTKTAEVYLCSEATAAASAIKGCIFDPRDLNIAKKTFEEPEKVENAFDGFIYPGDRRPVRRGPNINPIPSFDKMPDLIESEVMLKLGDDISTDHICPAGANYLAIRSNIPEMSKHAFEVVDESFYNRSQDKNNTFIVAGDNYGQGSSREQAAILPRYLGVRCVLAKSFARLHHANLINWGILPLIFINDEDYDKIESGDVLKIEKSNLNTDEIKVDNVSKSYSFMTRVDLSSENLESIKAGGGINQIGG